MRFGTAFAEFELSKTVWCQFVIILMHRHSARGRWLHLQSKVKLRGGISMVPCIICYHPYTYTYMCTYTYNHTCMTFALRLLLDVSALLVLQQLAVWVAHGPTLVDPAGAQINDS